MSRTAAAIVVAAAGLSLTLGITIWQPRSLQIQLPASRAAAEQLLELWRVTGNGSGGFASVSDLEPPLDLYATAWNLRLARTYHLDLPTRLDEGRIEAALEGVIDERGTEQSLPRLEAIHLSVSAMRDLEIPVPDDLVAARLNELRSGSGFTLNRGEPASDAALSVAITTMIGAGLNVPEEVTAALLSRLAATGGEATLQQMADSTIPLWVAADLTLSSEQRRPLRGALAEQINALWQDLSHTTPWDGAILALVADSIDIARANEIPEPTFVEARLWAPLERVDGYLAVAAESPSSDPQATVAAALLGRGAPDVLLRTFVAASGPLGWQMTGVETPTTTAMAEFVLQAFGLETYRPEVVRQCDMWLAGAKRAVRDADSLRQYVHFLAAYNRLATLVDAHPWVPDSTGWKLDLREWDGGDVAALTRALLLGDQHAGPIVDAISELPWSAPESVQDALDLFLVARLTGQWELEQAATAYLDTVRVGELYRASLDIEVPDLRSTATAYAMLGESSVSAAQRFATSGGFSLITDQLTEGGGTIESLYLGVGLATGFDNAALLP